MLELNKSTQSVKRVGYSGVSFIINRALNLRNHRYNGLDPGLALSKFRNGEEVAIAVRELVGRIEELKSRVKWSNGLEAEPKALSEGLNKVRNKVIRIHELFT